MAKNIQVLLAARPSNGRIDAHCFEVRVTAVPTPVSGEVLVRNVYLSCDPHLRIHMDTVERLPQPVASRVVGVVEQSRHPDFAVGDVVWGQLRWELFSVAPGNALRPVSPEIGPISHAITVRGVPGLTGYLAMTQIGRPGPGETVVVSAAAGAVGSIAGQFAKRAGARVVGIVGSETKAWHVLNVLGFDNAVNYRADRPLGTLLGEACRDGLDVYFDNVGGPIFEVALETANVNARFVVCGMISGYDDPATFGVRNLMRVVNSTVTIAGFRVSQHLDKLPRFSEFAARLVTRGELVYVEDIVEDIEAAPGAFIGMLRGDNIGKRLIQVSEDPYR